MYIFSFFLHYGNENWGKDANVITKITSQYKDFNGPKKKLNFLKKEKKWLIHKKNLINWEITEKNNDKKWAVF